jgi:UDP-N-acetylmuramoyl-tripeptide--D-alanyl-D-alanine ligase
MNRTDPFYGYSFLLRSIVYVLVPLFCALQFVRTKRALHVFQLEGYKRQRFLKWVPPGGDRALFLKPSTAKKPLVMTGRARRLLVTSLVLTVIAVLVVPGIAHLVLGGWPLDVGVWAIMTGLCFFGVRHVLVVADWLLTPVQRAINTKFLRAAGGRLDAVEPTVIGITGSFGKTSTKFAIQGVIGPSEEVLATPGSFNNPLGISRTINEHMTAEHRYFVAEMGAYGEGEIAELCDFVRPSVSVLTAVGPAHLERFGSLDAIRRAKYEIVQALPADGTAVMNVDDLEVRALADVTKRVPVIRYGMSSEARPDVTAADVEVTPEGTVFTVAVDSETLRVRTKLLGRHAVGHVLAAVGVARAIGLSLASLGARIEALQPVEHRLQLIKGAGGVTVIDDAYNSNPEGAAAALEVLDAMPGRQKIVVTPGIIELGTLQDDANQSFGARAGAVADHLIVVARVNREAIVAGAKEVDGANVITVDTLQEAQEELKRVLASGDVVLFENDLPDHYEG